MALISRTAQGMEIPARSEGSRSARPVRFIGLADCPITAVRPTVTDMIPSLIIPALVFWPSLRYLISCISFPMPAAELNEYSEETALAVGAMPFQVEAIYHGISECNNQSFSPSTSFLPENWLCEENRSLTPASRPTQDGAPVITIVTNRLSQTRSRFLIRF
jgi:hypothetical protein